MKKLLFLAPLCLCACMLQNEDQTSGQTIRLVPVSASAALGKTAISSSASDDPTASINLDTITGTVTEYFMIQNLGSQSITNVSLQSDNPNFSFSPSNISVLSPASQLNVQQIVALTISYGSVTGDSGQVLGTLKSGINTATISISGSTLNSLNTTLPLTESIALSVYAKLIDITAIDKNGTLNLLHPLGKASSPTLGPDFYPVFAASGDSLTLINTGNVSLVLNYWKNTDSAGAEVIFGVSDTVRMPIPSTIELNGGNVSSIPNELPISRNGNIYASFLDTLDLP